MILGYFTSNTGFIKTSDDVYHLIIGFVIMFFMMNVMFLKEQKDIGKGDKLKNKINIVEEL